MSYNFCMYPDVWRISFCLKVVYILLCPLKSLWRKPPVQRVDIGIVGREPSCLQLRGLPKSKLKNSHSSCNGPSSAVFRVCFFWFIFFGRGCPKSKSCSFFLVCFIGFIYGHRCACVCCVCVVCLCVCVVKRKKIPWKVRNLQPLFRAGKSFSCFCFCLSQQS